MSSEVDVNAPGEQEPGLHQHPPRVLGPGCLLLLRVVVPQEVGGLLLAQETVAIVTGPGEVICLDNEGSSLRNCGLNKVFIRGYLVLANNLELLANLDFVHDVANVDADSSGETKEDKKDEEED